MNTAELISAISGPDEHKARLMQQSLRTYFTMSECVIAIAKIWGPFLPGSRGAKQKELYTRGRAIMEADKLDVEALAEVLESLNELATVPPVPDYQKGGVVYEQGPEIINLKNQ